MPLSFLGKPTLVGSLTSSSNTAPEPPDWREADGVPDLSLFSPAWQKQRHPEVSFHHRLKEFLPAIGTSLLRNPKRG